MQREIAETARETTPGAVAEEPELAAHPGPRTYVEVAVILAVATALEVALYYITSLPHSIYAALLLFFMVIKFSLVVAWFMHLRFDSRIFRRLFITGILLAMTVYLIVLTIFGALDPPWLLGLVAVLLVIGAASFVFGSTRGRVRLEAEYLGPSGTESGSRTERTSRTPKAEYLHSGPGSDEG
jgi:cytochrome c oxidase subunit 4